jgi:hypothetical protein
MTATLTYCTGWNRILKAPAEILAADKARELHQARKPYCVVVECEDGVSVVEMSFFQIYCHVLFLDDRKRVANRYSFVEVSDGTLFLEEAAVHNYADDSNRPSHGELFVFREDGTVSHDTGKAGGGTMTRTESRTDVSRNYAAIPEFGRYESVLKRER